MFTGMLIAIVCLTVIIWSVAYTITAIGVALAEGKEGKRREARETEYRRRETRAREESAKLWEQRFAQMTKEEWDDVCAWN